MPVRFQVPESCLEKPTAFTPLPVMGPATVFVPVPVPPMRKLRALVLGAIVPRRVSVPPLAMISVSPPPPDIVMLPWMTLLPEVFVTVPTL